MKVRAIRDLLGTHPVFGGLDAGDLDLLAGCGTNVVFGPGTFLFRAGTAADQFFVLRRGRVAVEVVVPERGPLVVETLGPGEVLGWSWLFPPYRWHFDAEALETTHAVVMDGACLRGKCDDDARLGYSLMQRFARVMEDDLQATRLQLLDLYGDARPG